MISLVSRKNWYVYFCNQISCQLSWHFQHYFVFMFFECVKTQKLLIRLMLTIGILVVIVFTICNLSKALHYRHIFSLFKSMTYLFYCYCFICTHIFSEWIVLQLSWRMRLNSKLLLVSERKKCIGILIAYSSDYNLYMKLNWKSKLQYIQRT